MTQGQSPHDILKVTWIPQPLFYNLVNNLGVVYDPDKFDVATKSLDKSPSLLNFYLAAPFDLSAAGLGDCVHIPLQISMREGGRKSLFYLQSGEEPLLTGIIVTNQGGIALEYMQRMTGVQLPAETNSTYRIMLKSREGQQVWEGNLELEFATNSLGEPIGEVYFILVQSPRTLLFKCSFWSLLHTNW